MTGKPCSDELCDTMDTCATGKACYPDIAPPTKPCPHSLDERRGDEALHALHDRLASERKRGTPQEAKVIRHRPFSIFSMFLMIVSGMILAALMFTISITSN